MTGLCNVRQTTAKEGSTFSCRHSVLRVHPARHSKTKWPLGEQHTPNLGHELLPSLAAPP